MPISFKTSLGTTGSFLSQTYIKNNSFQNFFQYFFRKVSKKGAKILGKVTIYRYINLKKRCTGIRNI